MTAETAIRHGVKYLNEPITDTGDALLLSGGSSFGFLFCFLLGKETIETDRDYRTVAALPAVRVSMHTRSSKLPNTASVKGCCD